MCQIPLALISSPCALNHFDITILFSWACLLLLFLDRNSFELNPGFLSIPMSFTDNACICSLLFLHVCVYKPTSVTCRYVDVAMLYALKFCIFPILGRLALHGLECFVFRYLRYGLTTRLSSNLSTSSISLYVYSSIHMSYPVTYHFLHAEQTFL